MSYDHKRAEEIADDIFDVLDDCIEQDHLAEFLVAIAYVSGRSVGELAHVRGLGGLAGVQANFVENYNAGIMEAYGGQMPSTDSLHYKNSNDILDGIDPILSKRYLGVIN